MLNHIVMAGRLTKDPELRKAGEISVCSFRIACDRDFKTKDGEKETDFVDVVVWRKLADNVAKYFTKGRMAIVEGRLQIHPWTDQEGGKRFSTEIVAEHVYFGDSKPKSQDEDASEPPEGFVPDFGNEDGELPF
ncbi:Helix-destabilizing protein [uncultured Flavonifractor sp.]|nr:single stranded DNA-binding protein [Flavonifractor plautii]SCJ50778.1 Helix-destabilizing protein [uncultured Flavonifractor sp.]